jgi:DNA-directed RNA polymerase subunit RPC12/RpoP
MIDIGRILNMTIPNKSIPLHTAFESISNKLKSGHSPLCCVVCDETGIGKSMFASRASELIYNRVYGKTWTPSGNLFFSMFDFKKELFTSNNRIFIIEEAEIELGSDNWQSIQNRWFSRMKSTQRIKVNLYFVVLPMFMQLARKHRRAVNYLFDVKKRGIVYAYRLKKYSSQLFGEDMGKVFLGVIMYGLPDCKIEYDRLDIENKHKIEIKENFLMENELQKMNKKMGLDKEGMPVSITDKLNVGESNEGYVYKCFSCKAEIASDKKLTKAIKCPSCNQIVYLTDKDLLINRIHDLNDDEDMEDDE